MAGVESGSTALDSAAGLSTMNRTERWSHRLRSGAALLGLGVALLGVGVVLSTSHLTFHRAPVWLFLLGAGAIALAGFLGVVLTSTSGGGDAPARAWAGVASPGADPGPLPKSRSERPAGAEGLTVAGEVAPSGSAAGPTSAPTATTGAPPEPVVAWRRRLEPPAAWAASTPALARRVESASSVASEATVPGGPSAPMTPNASGSPSEGSSQYCAGCGRPLALRESWRTCSQCGRSLCRDCLGASLRTHGRAWCGACGPPPG